MRARPQQRLVMSRRAGSPISRTAADQVRPTSATGVDARGDRAGRTRRTWRLPPAPTAESWGITTDALWRATQRASCRGRSDDTDAMRARPQQRLVMPHRAGSPIGRSAAEQVRPTLVSGVDATGDRAGRTRRSS